MDSSFLLPLLLAALLIPLLLTSRKQKRQMNELQALQNSLADGDMVLTTSGLRAKVIDSSYEETIDLEIAPGVVTTWVRGAVREKLNPDAESTEDGTEPSADDAPATSAAADSTVDTTAADTTTVETNKGRGSS